MDELVDVLERRAERALVERCDRVGEWAEVRMGVFSHLEHVDSTLLLRDLVSGEDVSVLNLGALSGRDPDALLMGRLVPISMAPGLMFESRPIEVDEETAAAAVGHLHDDPVLGWFFALADAREAGRLERGFSCHDRTPFTSDLTLVCDRQDAHEETLAPALAALVSRGYSPDVANAVGVLGVALIAAEVAPHAAAAIAPQVVAALAALAVPGAFECAFAERIEPGHAAAFERLAEVTYGVASDRCRKLARAGRPAA